GLPPSAGTRTRAEGSLSMRHTFELVMASSSSARSQGRNSILVDGYVRVSQVAGRRGERFISPIVQRERIEAWATANGALIGHIFEELDESGARTDRPLFLTAIERVERRESDGVVVARLDRFGRSLMSSLEAIDRIQKAGGTFVAVD